MTRFASKFRLSELAVAEFQFWTVSLRPTQTTLGALVLSLKRSCPALSELDPAEAGELAVAFKAIEESLRSFVRFEKINYLALMMVDDQVHFHVLPRYLGTRGYGGRDFPDADWPRPIERLDNGPQDSAILAKIAEDLRLLFLQAGCPRLEP